MITPMDIHNKEFEKGFRGYDTDAVDAFLSELVHDYEVLYRDNREMTDKIEQLEKRLAQYEQMEETMNNTLVLAQETGESVKSAARKEADLIIQEADQQRKQILEDAERSLREGQEQYAVMRNEIAVFKAKMESILTSQLQLLDGCVLGESKVPLKTADPEFSLLNADEATQAASEGTEDIVAPETADEQTAEDVQDAAESEATNEK